jgi:hypothetical protein
LVESAEAPCRVPMGGDTITAIATPSGWPLDASAPDRTRANAVVCVIHGGECLHASLLVCFFGGAAVERSMAAKRV